jgi:hypothetical protein
MAWTTAGSRSGMGGYELHDELSEQFSGLQAGISQISPAELAVTVRKSILDGPLIIPILVKNFA